MNAEELLQKLIKTKETHDLKKLRVVVFDNWGELDTAIEADVIEADVDADYLTSKDNVEVFTITAQEKDFYNLKNYEDE